MGSPEQQLAQLQGEVARLAGAYGELQTNFVALQNANATLQATLVGGMATLPTLVQSVQELVRDRSSKQGLIDTKGIGRPYTFGDKEDKFPAWVRKTENFVIGALGEPFREVLKWAVEQDVAIAKNDWIAEFGPTLDTSRPTPVIHDLDDKVHQVYTALVSLTEDDSNDLVIGAGDGNGLEAWRRLHRRWDPSTGGRKRTLLKAIIAPPKCTITELAGCLERWQQQVSKYERRKNDAGQREKVSEDIRMAAIEMLVPTDLENHLVLNKHRLRTFEDVYAEVTSILEARTGVKIKEPSIKTAGGGAADMEVDSFSKGKGDKGGKGKGKGKGKKGQEEKPSKGAPTQKFEGYCDNCGKWGHKKATCWKPAAPGGKGAGKGDKGGKGKGKGKKGKAAGSLDDESAADWTKEPEAEHASLDISAVDVHLAASGPPGGRKDVDLALLYCDDLALLLADAEEPRRELAPLSQEEWIQFNLDSGAAVSAFPKHLAPPGLIGNGRNYKTASGEFIPDEGSVRLKAEDEYGRLRGVTGRVTAVHKPLIAASQCADKGQNSWLTKGGGWMVQKDSEVSKKVESLLQKEAAKAEHEMLPIYEENGVYNFYLRMGRHGSIAPLEESKAKVEDMSKEDLVKLVKQLQATSSGKNRQQ